MYTRQLTLPHCAHTPTHYPTLCAHTPAHAPALCAHTPAHAPALCAHTPAHAPGITMTVLPVCSASRHTSTSVSTSLLYLCVCPCLCLYIRMYTATYRVFPGDSVMKNLSASAEDVGDGTLIPGSGRSPGVGNGNPLQYSCLESPTDRGAWRATVTTQRLNNKQVSLNDVIRMRP